MFQKTIEKHLQALANFQFGIIRNETDIANEQREIEMIEERADKIFRDNNLNSVDDIASRLRHLLHAHDSIPIAQACACSGILPRTLSTR